MLGFPAPLPRETVWSRDDDGHEARLTVERIPRPLQSPSETGTGPLKFTLVVRDPVQPGAQPAEPIASFVLVCNLPSPLPATAQAPGAL
jgi:hypothetical protein